jgi:hypothetical protein
MDTNGSASVEDGRMSYGSPGHFGKTLGESEGIYPGTMANATKGDHRRQRARRGTL